MNRKGDIVVLDDGGVGEVTWANAHEIQVVHGDRTIGRGPWWMFQLQCRRADAATMDAYLARVML
jgi:hypothetical protein